MGADREGGEVPSTKSSQRRTRDEPNSILVFLLLEMTNSWIIDVDQVSSQKNVLTFVFLATVYTFQKKNDNFKVS